jgi:ABC-2 type transport system ATP-binding protein
LTQRLSPCRLVRLELKTPLAAPALSAYGQVEAIDGREVRLLIERDQLTGAVARLLGDLEVLDLEVADPPIEDLIGQLFQQGVVQ